MLETQASLVSGALASAVSSSFVLLKLIQRNGQAFISVEVLGKDALSLYRNTCATLTGTPHTSSFSPCHTCQRRVFVLRTRVRVCIRVFVHVCL